MTDKDKNLVRVVFHELDRLPYKQLNTILGSVTIKEMHELLLKLETEEYRRERNIKFQCMTDEDFDDYALWRANREGYPV